mgnify:CR=1 FL=1
MCIRDSQKVAEGKGSFGYNARTDVYEDMKKAGVIDPTKVCLLYTSDAADERSSVDLGGRRIIKKKKTQDTHCDRHYSNIINNMTKIERQNHKTIL